MHLWKNFVIHFDIEIPSDYRSRRFHLSYQKGCVEPETTLLEVRSGCSRADVPSLTSSCNFTDIYRRRNSQRFNIKTNGSVGKTKEYIRKDEISQKLLLLYSTSEMKYNVDADIISPNNNFSWRIIHKRCLFKCYKITERQFWINIV